MEEQVSMSAVFEFMSQSAVTTVTTVCLLHTDMAAHVGSYMPEMLFHMSTCPFVYHPPFVSSPGVVLS